MYMTVGVGGGHLLIIGPNFRCDPDWTGGGTCASQDLTLDMNVMGGGGT